LPSHFEEGFPQRRQLAASVTASTDTNTNNQHRFTIRCGADNSPPA
jgi:hypothetical protein